LNKQVVPWTHYEFHYVNGETEFLFFSKDDMGRWNAQYQRLVRLDDESEDIKLIPMTAICRNVTGIFLAHAD